ncbi:MAG: hypothetical protein IPM25_00940 [Chloracidobacterium sp.]|nr:hypothetical protein [Chloracidobacterium sp.]
MVPSSRWFPTTLQDRAAWFQNFNTQFASLHIALGFTAGDATTVSDDNDMMQFIAEAAVAVDAFSDAMRTFRKQVTEGTAGGPVPTVPGYTSPGTPADVGAGIYERLDNLVKRIRLSPTYNEEEGALLGIVPVSPSGPVIEDVPPKIKAAAYPGSQVQVKFIKGDSSGVVIETKLDNSETWNSVGNYSNSPVFLNIPTNPENLPRAVQVRARYLEHNTPVGQYSDIVVLSTLPAA